MPVPWTGMQREMYLNWLHYWLQSNLIAELRTQTNSALCVKWRPNDLTANIEQEIDWKLTANSWNWVGGVEIEPLQAWVIARCNLNCNLKWTK